MDMSDLLTVYGDITCSVRNRAISLKKLFVWTQVKRREGSVWPQSDWPPATHNAWTVESP